MNEIFIIQSVVELIAIGIGFYFVYVKSFMGQKGKNLATKEDIGAITKEIEQVKQEYTKGVELFKSQTDLIASNNKEHYKDSKKVIMDFYDAFVLFRYHVVTPILTLNRIETFSKWVDDADILQKEVVIQKERFDLFVNNDALKNQAIIMVGIVFDYRELKLLCEYATIETSIQLKEYAKRMEAENKTQESSVLDVINETAASVAKDYTEKLDNKYKELRSGFAQFKQTIREHFDMMNNPAKEEKL